MKLINLKGLQQKTSLSCCTLRRYIQNFGLPCYQVGRKILVNPDEFEQWIEQFKSVPQTHGNDIKKVVQGTLKKLGLPSA